MNQVPDYSALTIASYEDDAAHYDTLCTDDPSADVATALDKLLAIAPAGGTVLEIGSGPGRDADYLEAHGLRVHRTDATQSFIRLQAERGRSVEPLNMISDALGGPYDAVLAMCVLIHVDRATTGTVLHKIATALHPDGTYLVSIRDGDGELTDDEYHMTYWRRDEFTRQLADANLTVEWENHHIDSGGDPWLTFLGKAR